MKLLKKEEKAMTFQVFKPTQANEQHGITINITISKEK